METSSPRSICTILANFGGPRSLSEIESFLGALLTDGDVVRTGLPKPINNLMFRKIAKRRSKKVAKDYEAIGGKSPIYDDTEAVAAVLRERLPGPVISFHRYLPDTHADFITAVAEQQVDEFRVFPMFPQFTYATSGSIARWFQENLSWSTTIKMRWIKSYPEHPAFVRSYQATVREYLDEQKLPGDDTILLFSAHGIPASYVLGGDIYQWECQRSWEAMSTAFPTMLTRLSFQSKFGPGEWLRPYTIDACNTISEWCQGRKNVVFVPIAFTSDHIETLVEIEDDYMPVIRKKGLNAFRCPALNRRKDWIEAIVEILDEKNVSTNQMLIRPT